MRREDEPLDEGGGLAAERAEHEVADAEADEWDVAEQRRGMQPDAGEQVSGPDPMAEADEADVADQQWSLPQPADDEER